MHGRRDRQPRQRYDGCEDRKSRMEVRSRLLALDQQRTGGMGLVLLEGVVDQMGGDGDEIDEDERHRRRAQPPRGALRPLVFS
jgi:hypothetical protein